MGEVRNEKNVERRSFAFGKREVGSERREMEPEILR